MIGKSIDSGVNHFLDMHDIDADTLQNIIDFAKKDKADDKSGTSNTSDVLKGRQVALVFEKPSTRTRVSFEVAISKLGGNAIVLDSKNTQLGRGETIADTAKVLSTYVDVIMLRCFQHDTLLDMAKNATIPVINGLTDYSHPCQVMADIMTFEEIKGSIKGKKIAWIGDCNNMANTWIQAVDKFGFTLTIACPEELEPPANLPKGVTIVRDPKEAAKGADLVTTDTWVSMGDEDPEGKMKLLQGYQVDDAVMAVASKSAIFMHCMPAHRGQEVSASVIDGDQSVIEEEAKNRMYVQKAIILWCLNKIQGGQVVGSEPYKDAKVLIVEDNQADAAAARKIFDTLGCAVTVAYDGETAIQKVKENPFDVIFIDCLMPVMNGFEATKQIRQAGNYHPIIGITGKTAEGEQERGAQVGMNDFITKPLGPRRIMNLMGKWYKK